MLTESVWPPTMRLFVYDIHIQLELAVACYWLGLHEQAIDINKGLINRGHLPDGTRKLVLRNPKYSREAIRNRKTAA